MFPLPESPWYEVQLLRGLCVREVQNYLQILARVSQLASLLFQFPDDFSGSALAASCYEYPDCTSHLDS